MTAFDWAAWGGVALTLIGSFSVFLMSSEKEVQPRLIAYMIVFFGVGLVFRRSFSTQLVFATVLTGTISAVILGAPNFSRPFRFPARMSRSVLLMRALIGLIFAAAVWLYLPRFANWLPIVTETLLSSMLIFVFGLLTFGLGTRLIDRFFGLLFLTQGFLMMYVSLEKSTAVFGFLLFFELALALLGSYCLTNADGEGERGLSDEAGGPESIGGE